MSKYFSNEPYHKVGGVLWLVHMWLIVYFSEFLDREPTSYKTLGLHVTHSLRAMPSNDLMSFFLELVDWALVHLYFMPNSIHISASNHILASSQPYLHACESRLAFASTACRVLVSGGSFTFLSLKFASSTSLLPYLPCL